MSFLYMQLKTVSKLRQRNQNNISNNTFFASDKIDEASSEELILRPQAVYTHNKIYSFTPKCSSLTTAKEKLL